jgi:hypothetical protein
MPGLTISVIVPLYNKERYIARAVDSVLAQTWPDYELLVIDDGSSDGGVRLLHERFHDSRLRVVSQANAGEGGARNRGIAEMRGSIAAFLDADDEWLPWHLADLAELAQSFPDAGLLATGYRQLYAAHATEHSINRTGPVLVPDYFELARSGYAIHISGCGVRREVLESGVRFRERAPLGADIEFYARAGMVAPLAYHPRVSSIYHRFVDGSVMGNTRWQKTMPILPALLIERLNAPDGGGERRDAMMKYLAWLLLEHAEAGVRAGRTADAIEILKEAQNCPITASGKSRMLRFAACLAWTPSALVVPAFRFHKSKWWMRAAGVLRGRAGRVSDPSATLVATRRYQASKGQPEINAGTRA